MSNPTGPLPREELFPGSHLEAEELEFIQAIEQFKKRYNRRYPTWSEILFVLKKLGYRREMKTQLPVVSGQWLEKSREAEKTEQEERAE